jgi:putative peptidoglycan binding protein
MRSRLLVSAAILVAGVAMASAQYAPDRAGRERNQLRKEERSQDHRAPDAVAGKMLGRPVRTAGFGFQDSMKSGVKNVRENPRHATPKGHGESLPLQTSLRSHNGRSDLLSPAKHNDASVQPARSQWGRGTARDRSAWDRAMAQGRMRSEQGRTGHSDRQGLSRSPMRTGHRQPPASVTKERGRQDVALNDASRRRPDRGTERTGEHKPHNVANVAQNVAPHSRRHRGGASRTGQIEIRNVQAALNQRGFDVGNADGKLGRHTKAALTAFQKQRGLHPTGKADRETLHALVAGRTAPGASRDNNEVKNRHGVEKGIAPSQPSPRVVEPSTTGQNSAQPTAASPQPNDAEMPTAPGGLQAPDGGVSGRVPASSPQEDYQDGEIRSDSDQR